MITSTPPLLYWRLAKRALAKTGLERARAWRTVGIETTAAFLRMEDMVMVLG